jgi:hypothetical protein
MTDIEDRVRRDMRSLAQRTQPGMLRPLELPVRRGFRTGRWLAPALAMVAVAAVAASVSLARQAAHPAQSSATGCQTHAWCAGGPRYYVTLTSTSSIQQQYLTVTVTVRDSVTGAVVTSQPLITQAAHIAQGPVLISGAADDRIFLIFSYSGSELLQLSADGQIASIRPLPSRLLPAGPYEAAQSAALSPDGTEAAFSFVRTTEVSTPAQALPGQRRGGQGGELRTESQTLSSGIAVVSLATGRTRTWLTTRRSGGFAIGRPAWASSGTSVLFQWRRSYRLLDVAGPGGSLLADSRPVAATPQPFGVPPFAQLTPAGNAQLTTDAVNVNTPGRHGAGVAYVRIVEASLVTGRVLRVLHVGQVSYAGGDPEFGRLVAGADSDCNLLSLAPTGLHALIQCSGFGRLDGNRFTPLPGLPSATSGSHGSMGFTPTAAW